LSALFFISVDKRVKRKPDTELIAACLSGNARSWDALIERYEGFIYTLAIRMGLTAADAEDVFQNVCLRLYQNLGSLRDATRLSSWLISTTRREAWHLRRHRGMPVMSDMPDFEAEMDRARRPGEQEPLSLEETFIALEEQHLVRTGMAELPEECRKLLSLLYNDDSPRSYSEVAGEMSMPVGSIGPRRARCLARLKKILDRLAP
jgi:RNA polymerase sigma factor (sigma-70 family)